MTALLETFRCLRCGYGWRTTRAKKPCKCPSCTSTSWDTPYVRQIDGKGLVMVSETQQQVVERLMRAAAEILLTNSRCSIGKNREGHYVAITPVLLQRWKTLPDRYGTVVAHLDRESMADEVGTALFGRHWQKGKAA